MPLDLSKVDQSALKSSAGILTSEWQAFQSAHGAAKVVIGLGMIVTIASGIAAAFPTYPQWVALGGLVAGLASTVAGNLLSKGAASDYQDARSETKVGMANAVAAVVQSHAEVATAAQAPTQVTIQEAPAAPTAVAIATAPVAAPPATPVPSSSAPIVPAVLQALLLCTVLFLTGCMSDQGRQDATLNTESIYTSTEALRITLGIPQGIADLDLTKPLTPAQKCQVYIYNIEKQAGALGGFLTVTPPNPIPAAGPSTPAPSTK